MGILRRVKTTVWIFDPGYLNLKQALKAILSILMVLYVLRKESFLIIVLSALVTGMALQGVVAKKWTAKLIQALLFDALYFAMTTLGFLIRHHPHWVTVILVLLGFLLNYLRRFGLEKSMMPISAWVLCFIPTIYPFNTVDSFWPYGQGVLLGLLISLVVLLFIFPDNERRVFIKNANLLFENLAQGLQEMRFALLQGLEQKKFADFPFVARKTKLDKLMDANLGMQTWDSLSPNDPLPRLLRQQYALVHAYAFLLQIFYGLWQSQPVLARSTKLALCYMSKKMAQQFSNAYVNEKGDVLNRGGPLLLSRNLNLVSTDPQLVMILINFKLSFDLLLKHGNFLQDGTQE